MCKGNMMVKRLLVLIFLFVLVVLSFPQQMSYEFKGFSLIWPMGDGTREAVKITSPFGYRDDVKLPRSTGGAEDSIHFAVDMIPADGSATNIKILAAGDGVAVNVYPAPNGYYRGHRVFGGCAEIKHVFAIINGEPLYAYTFYGHMKEVWVREGQVLKQGESIGLMGSTGDSTGPHLHFEFRMNPLDILTLSDEMRYSTVDIPEKDIWLLKKRMGDL